MYHYYRDLIKFYSRGNPQFMLKCINPKEAALLDFAAGIHIRFRLAGVFNKLDVLVFKRQFLMKFGKCCFPAFLHEIEILFRKLFVGKLQIIEDFPAPCLPTRSSQHHIHLFQEKFPPNIYYKIYTYRPVTDVNSFAPRDYTVSNWAAPGATVKNSRVKNPNDREGMYSIRFVLPALITPYSLTHLLSQFSQLLTPSELIYSLSSHNSLFPHSFTLSALITPYSLTHLLSQLS